MVAVAIYHKTMPWNSPVDLLRFEPHTVGRADRAGSFPRGGELRRSRELRCGTHVLHVHDNNDGVGIFCVHIGSGYHQALPYSGVGLGDVAGQAGVDVTLVRRYFGSKQLLFTEATDVSANVEEIRNATDDALGRQLIARVLEARRDVEAPLFALVRSSGDPSVVARLQKKPMASARDDDILAVFLEAFEAITKLPHSRRSRPIRRSPRPNSLRPPRARCCRPTSDTLWCARYPRRTPAPRRSARSVSMPRCSIAPRCAPGPIS